MNVLGKLSKFGAALALSTSVMAFPAIAQKIEDPSARNSSNSGSEFRGNREAALRGGPNSGNRAAPAERSRGDRAHEQRGDRGRNNTNATNIGGATIQPVSATDDRGRRGNRGNQARGNRGARRGNQARGNNRNNFRGNRANNRGNFRGNRGNNVRRGNNARRTFNRGFNQGRRNNFRRNNIRRNNFRRNNFGFYNRGYIAPIYRAPIYHNAPVYVAPVYAVGGFYGLHESTIIINDYGGYGLYAPPRGYHWVYDNGSSDAILAAVATGAIIAVAADILSTPY